MLLTELLSAERAFIPIARARGVSKINRYSDHCRGHWELSVSEDCATRH